jgi:protocatechuate 3,4-dioxygenase, beta subunit
MMHTAPSARRRLLAGAACTLALPWLATARAAAPAMAAMTDGPFYPSPAWRTQGPLAGDWDTDLTRVQRAGRTLQAQGEHLALTLQVQDSGGRVVDGVGVEIWQCDALAQYRHPRVALEEGRFDPGFQGHGEARAGRDGSMAFRTIRPVAYPGRTPHIHIKLRHASFGEFTSQLFIDGDAGNARDFLWRAVPEAQRPALAIRLVPATADGLRWQARHTLVLPA